jgi:hypothetical protein
MQRFGKYLGRADADLEGTAHVGSGVKAGMTSTLSIRLLTPRKLPKLLRYQDFPPSANCRLMHRSMMRQQILGPEKSPQTL